MCHTHVMSALDLDLELVERMRAFGAKGASPTILLGAGASVNSGLPGWDELVIRLLVESGAVTSEDAARRLLQSQDPTIAAEAARASVDEERWKSLILASLLPADGELTPTDLHEAVAQFALEAEDAPVALITLNFDTLLERALHDAGRESSYSASVDAPLVDAEELIVHHLHGVVDQSGQDSVVLTFGDFNSVLAETDSWQETLIAAAVVRGPLLIAGTSYRDPDLRQWVHRALAAAPPLQPPVVLIAREGFKVNRAEFEEISGALEAQWRAVGLSPILIQDHADAAQLIRESRWVDAPGYRPPRQRSQDVWKVHEEHFSQVQRNYNEFLREDAELLRRKCGVQAMNLTLWLADEDGMLARWATQDRMYIDPAAVRRVPSGHDSPWVAAQAMSSEGLLVQNIEKSPTGRWASVFGLAVRVSGMSGRWPSHATGALTVAFADSKERVGDQWRPSFEVLAAKWGRRITKTVSENEGTLETEQRGTGNE